MLVVVVGLLAGCSDPEPRIDADDAPPVAAPDPSAELAPGAWPELAAMIRAANRDGRPVVVNLFASWCEPCKEEAPVLRAAAEAHPEVAFVGVNHRDLMERAEQTLEDYPLGFPTLWDFEGGVAEAIRARGMPTTAFFDSAGVMQRHHTGMVTEELLSDAIADIVPEG